MGNLVGHIVSVTAILASSGSTLWQHPLAAPSGSSTLWQQHPLAAPSGFSTTLFNSSSNNNECTNKHQQMQQLELRMELMALNSFQSNTRTIVLDLTRVQLGTWSFPIISLKSRSDSSNWNYSHCSTRRPVGIRRPVAQFSVDHIGMRS